MFNSGILDTVIGVIDNVVMTSPYAPVDPLMVYYSGRGSSEITTRLKEGVSPQKAIALFKQIYATYSPADIFEYQFVDQEFGKKFIGEEWEWAEATETLRQAAEDSGLELVPDPGGAAFYGPKISVQAKDAIGRTWQMSTIQLDFNQPKRFGLEYQAADGTRQQPVMIHRALFGSVERFFGVLLEHYAGAFPPWLSPVQA